MPRLVVRPLAHSVYAKTVPLPLRIRRRRPKPPTAVTTSRTATTHYTLQRDQPRTGPAIVDEGALLGLPWCNASVQLVAGLLSSRPMLNPDTKEPVKGFWDFPTPDVGYTKRDLLSSTIATLMIHSNAYWRIIEWDNYMRPSLVLPVHPSQVWVHTRPYSGVREYYVEGEGHSVSAWELIHFRGLQLLGNAEAISLIAIAAAAIRISLQEQQTADLVLRDGGIPLGGYLSTEQALGKPEAYEQAKAWYEGQGGRGSLVTVLSRGMEWKTIGLSSVDLELVSSRKLSAVEQCAIMRVPPHMVGAPVEGTSMTYSNVSQSLTSFKRLTLDNLTETISQTLAHYDLPVMIDTGDIIEPTLPERWKAYGQAIKDQWVTIDEARGREGMPPMPESEKPPPPPPPMMDPMQEPPEADDE